MPPKKVKSLSERLEEALYMDKKMLKFFKNQNEKKFKKDHIIDITNTLWQADLLGMPIDPTNGFRYALIVVCVNTGVVHAEAQERKDAEATLKAFKRIMDRYKPNIKTLQTDHGGEFKNKIITDYLKTKNIKHLFYNLYNKNSMAIVENMNGLISNMIYKQLAILTLLNKKHQDATQYSTDWVGLLQRCVRTINQYNYDKYGIAGKNTLYDLIKKTVELDDDILEIGDIVYLRKKRPESIIDGQPFYGTFRYGDVRFDYLHPQKVTRRLIRSGRPVRYFLDDNDNVSYKRADLLLKP